MIQTLNKELFWKNLDTSLLLLIAFKSQFEDIKLVKSYAMLVNIIPQLTKESIEILETVFLDTQDEEDSMDNGENEQKPESSLRLMLI